MDPQLVSAPSPLPPSDHGAASSTNFRYRYLKRVPGLQNVVDAKCAIEQLLSADVVSHQKLVQFCLKYEVPANYRTPLWLYVLGIHPLTSSVRQAVKQLRQEQYDVLLHSLKVMRMSGELDIPSPSSPTTMMQSYTSDDSMLDAMSLDAASESNQYAVILKMFLLEEGRLQFDARQLLEPSSLYFVQIARVISSELTADPTELYWLSAAFFRHLRAGLKQQQTRLVEDFRKLLKRKNCALYDHIVSANLMTRIPIDEWLCSAFAGVIPPSPLLRVWDKLIGNRFDILSHCAAEVVVFHRYNLERVASPSECNLRLFTMLSEEHGDLAVSHAVNALARVDN